MNLQYLAYLVIIPIQPLWLFSRQICLFIYKSCHKSENRENQVDSTLAIKVQNDFDKRF